jgi:phenylacetate-CoA ligase
VQGRSTDFVVAADGTIMHGLALIYVVRDLPGIERFRIVQESEQHTRVILQPGNGYDPTTARTIRDGLRRRLGMGVRIDVEAVPELPPEPSGKFRYVVSRVAASRA